MRSYRIVKGGTGITGGRNGLRPNPDIPGDPGHAADGQGDLSFERAGENDIFAIDKINNKQI